MICCSVVHHEIMFNQSPEEDEQSGVAFNNNNKQWTKWSVYLTKKQLLCQLTYT